MNQYRKHPVDVAIVTQRCEIMSGIREPLRVSLRERVCVCASRVSSEVCVGNGRWLELFIFGDGKC